MHDRRTSGQERIAAFLHERLRPALYAQRLPMDVAAWHIPGEPAPVDVALRADYTPFPVGESWGRPWSTTWFRTGATVPERWAGRRVEAVFDLGFDPTRPPSGQAEALVHDAAGLPLQGIHAALPAVPVSLAAHGGQDVRLLVEAAANPHIEGATGAGAHYGDPATAGDTPLYRLLRADLAVRDEDVWHLVHDIETLLGLMAHLPPEQPRTHEIRQALEAAVDAVEPRAVARTAHRARTLLAPVLARRAHESAHTLAAVATAHLDSAWLWPMRETVRKCARTFSTMAALAEEYPELVVAASSAQQYAWMRTRQPRVFERVRKAVAAGQWRPVGGMWVEADAELPGGESLVRQFVHGRRFLREELGVETDGVWLPDATGITAALPQIAALCGARWLLTRRPADTLSPGMPHHTFRWEGLDGTGLLTHLAPPAHPGTLLTGADVTDAVDRFEGKGPASTSLIAFGHHGAGPDRDMLERARRLADLDGAPRVVMRAPADFFHRAAQDQERPPVWRGELELEPHHGGYTSQARTKHGNRRAEHLLREAELWSATAAVRDAAPYPYDELEELWKKVLVHQCHDILPGSSIAWVHEDAEQAHREVHRRLERLVRAATGRPDGGAFLNAGPCPRSEVVVLGSEFWTEFGADGMHAPDTVQPLPHGELAVLAEAPALGAGPGIQPLGERAPVTVTALGDGGHLLDNGILRCHVDGAGLVRSLVELRTGREAIAPGAAGNLLQLHRDDPARWSAVHLDPRYRQSHRDLDTALSVEPRAEGPLLAILRVTRTTGRSTVVQDLSLAAGSPALGIDTDIDWREQDTVLKAAWPLDVHAEHTRAEVQFGHVARAAHENAGREAERYEQWGHRWVHVAEHGWGVALASDATYGYDVARHTRPDGGTTTTVRHSLLRAPHSPDPHADRGAHHFRHRIRPGADVGAAIAEGYALNLPLRTGSSATDRGPLVHLDHPDVLVEAVKLADDRGGDVVVRLYESRGGRVSTTLTTGFPLAEVHESDLLEEPLTALPATGDRVPLTLRPFQILTLRLRPAGSARA